MTRFEVQRCVGNTIEVLGIYETKEEMLAAANRFALQYACQSGIINGVSGKPDENGRRKSGEIRRMYCPPLSSRCDILLGLQSGEHRHCSFVGWSQATALDLLALDLVIW